MLAQFALSRIYFWPWASTTVNFTEKLEAFWAISAFYYAGEFDWLCQPYVLQIGQIIRFKMDSVGVKTRIFILLGLILEFTLIMAATALKA